MKDKAELGGRWGLTDFRSRVTLLLSDNEGCLYLCFFGTRQLMPRDRPWLSSREENTDRDLYFGIRSFYMHFPKKDNTLGYFLKVI